MKKMKKMKIYHYTSIESLVSILSNRTVKFSRLDKVDDLDEGRIEFKGTPLSHIFFASCWSTDYNESIPMWRLYTRDGIGVRIGLDSDKLFGNPFPPLNKKDIEYIVKKYLEKKNPAEIDGELVADEITDEIEKEIYETVGNKHYDEFPIVNSPINYEQDPLAKIKDAIVPYDATENKGLIFDNHIVGLTKDISWAFQREYRFLKMILPRDHKTTNMRPGDDFNTGWTETFNLLLSGQEPEEAPGIPLEEVFIPVGDEAFSNLEIILGPNCKDEHKFIVEAICEKLGLKPHISQSYLTGRIRFK